MSRPQLPGGAPGAAQALCDADYSVWQNVVRTENADVSVRELPCVQLPKEWETDPMIHLVPTTAISVVAESRAAVLVVSLGPLFQGSDTLDMQRRLGQFIGKLAS